MHREVMVEGMAAAMVAMMVTVRCAQTLLLLSSGFSVAE
jgi:hypothetical protein